MKAKLLSSIATIPLVVGGVVVSTSFADAATIGSHIDFSGNIFANSAQFDFVGSPALPVAASPNVDGSFQVLNASGSFAPALTFPPQIGAIRDFRQGITPGIIVQAGPVLNGSNNPAFYVPDFLRLTTPGPVNFTFQLETLKRDVVISADSDPSDPLITNFSSNFTGTLTDLLNNEVQAAVGSFTPNVGFGSNFANTRLSQLNPTDFTSAALYSGSLQVVSEPTAQAVPEPTTNAGLALFGVFAVGYAVNKRKKLTQVKLPGSKS